MSRHANSTNPLKCEQLEDRTVLSTGGLEGLPVEIEPGFKPEFESDWIGDAVLCEWEIGVDANGDGGAWIESDGWLPEADHYWDETVTGEVGFDDSWVGGEPVEDETLYEEVWITEDAWSDVDWVPENGSDWVDVEILPVSVEGEEWLRGELNVSFDNEVLYYAMATASGIPIEPSIDVGVEGSEIETTVTGSEPAGQDAFDPVFVLPPDGDRVELKRPPEITSPPEFTDDVAPELPVAKTHAAEEVVVGTTTSGTAEPAESDPFDDGSDLPVE